jgi:hypothetical protein
MYVYEQREGTGLLEYQVMPSLCAIDHDGVLSTFSKRSAPDQGKCMVWSVRADGMGRLSRTKSPPAGGLGHSPLASQAGRHVRPAL